MQGNANSFTFYVTMYLRSGTKIKNYMYCVKLLWHLFVGKDARYQGLLHFFFQRACLLSNLQRLPSSFVKSSTVYMYNTRTVCAGVFNCVLQWLSQAIGLKIVVLQKCRRLPALLTMQKKYKEDPDFAWTYNMTVILYIEQVFCWLNTHIGSIGLFVVITFFNSFLIYFNFIWRISIGICLRFLYTTL